MDLFYPKKRASTLSLVVVIVALALLSSTPASANDDNPLAPINYSTPIAKKLAEYIDNPQMLKKTTIQFVDSANASLTCKMSVFPFYEMVMRLMASAKAMQASGVKSIQDSAMQSFQTETRLQLEEIDEYCLARK